MADDLWIFGYGSLIWRADFPFVAARAGTISGWARRFWQGSEDHRGVPGRPGRVVTLIEAPGTRCAGRVYRIAAGDRAQVLAHLDYREKGGYQRLETEVDVGHGCQRIATTYLATADNPCFLGEASPHLIARQIESSHGPSGSNLDYLVQLYRQQPEDPHIAEIVNALTVSPA